MELIHVSGNTDCLLGKTAVGIYRIDDTRCILFDNGYSKEYDELVGSLKDAGLTPAGLIVSHAHIDHHGNSKRLREAFQIPLAMSLGEAAADRLPGGAGTVYQLFRALRRGKDFHRHRAALPG